MLRGLDGKAGNPNVEMKQTQKRSGCFGEIHCLIFGFAETKTGWPGSESRFTSKSSVQDRLHKQFQLWLASALNKQLSSLGIFQLPVGWQRKDLQRGGLQAMVCSASAGPRGCISSKAGTFSHPPAQYRPVYWAEPAALAGELVHLSML